MLTRKRVAELMDDPALDYTSHAEALRGLERLNFVSTSAASLWSQIKPLTKRSGDASPLRILDIATGGGDIPVALLKAAASDGVQVEIVGSDLSQSSVTYASQYALKKQATVDFIQLDALNDKLPENFDVVMTNLFTHHLDPPDVIKLLTKMAGAARQMVLVNDLVRSEIAYALVWLGTRLLSRSAIVQYDGPVSVQGSFTGQEFLRMAGEADLKGCEIKPCPPCRQILVWKRHD
ncbi:MAG: methyltransferase domain-containing protein [Candidatus Melainabacteria bacterium]|nr:methyltransferase domain-containing protein [Candidatus Melainabacteria bacterium]